MSSIHLTNTLYYFSTSNYDHHISIFSPQGRLYQMEYCFKAATSSSGLTSVATTYPDGACLVTQKKAKDRLSQPHAHIFRLLPNMGACLTGSVPDAMAWVQRARYEANKWTFDHGLPCPVSVLAKRMADLAQVNSQTASMRPLAVIALIIGYDDDDGSNTQCFRVDCAGHYFPYRAAAAGSKEQEALNQLEKNWHESLDETAGVRLAITTLGHVLGSDFRGSELEMACLRHGKFVLLTEDEIESHLNAIADDADA